MYGKVSPTCQPGSRAGIRVDSTAYVRRLVFLSVRRLGMLGMLKQISRICIPLTNMNPAAVSHAYLE